MKNRAVVTGLQREFLRAIRECIDMGHYPLRFLNLLVDHGPVITAVHLVMAHLDSESVESLVVLQRMDLTVEDIILRKPYRQLFAPEVPERAEQKLREVGYLV